MDIYKDYLTCHCQGFHLKILRENYEKDFMEICCQGFSREIIPFTPVSSSPYARVFSFEFRGQKYFHKTYLGRDWLEPLKDLFRCSRAERALRGHLLLQENGFFAPRVNVVGRKGSHNFMVSQAVRQCRKMPQFLRQMPVGSAAHKTYPQRRKFVRRLGRVIGQLHHRRIVHGDLRPANVIIDTSDPYHWDYFFLDNERNVRYRQLPQRKRLKNLVQLNMISEGLVTRTDRLRFFKAYLGENPELRLQKKVWLVRIIGKTERRLAERVRHHAAGIGLTP